MRKLTLDFETRSRADIKVVGAWLYSRHPSTEVMCLGWSLGLEAAGQWRMGDPPPRDLFDLFADVAEVEAHNAHFEMCVWLNVCHLRYGWPLVPAALWHCSAARVAACGLPRGLGDAGHALGLSTVKDEAEGRWAMLRLTKPMKNNEWDMDPTRWANMLRYNMGDVAAEEALSDATPPLPPAEVDAWRLTEKMNMRGFAVDVEGARAAVKMSGEHARILTAKFQEITGLETAGQRAKFMAWLAGRGVVVTNTQAKTLDALLSAKVLDVDARRAVEIVRALGRSSVKKYRAVLEMADADGRVRGTLLHNGAHTGRWAGRGVQPQNFKREGPADMIRAWDDIRDIRGGDLELVEMVHGDPLAFLGSAARGVIWAPDSTLRVGDFAQIEPRVLFWLSGDERGLDVFRAWDAGTGPDIYLVEASMIFNRTVHRHESEKRFLGKHAVLSLGYGAGFVKYLVHCRDLGAPRFTWAQVCDAVPAGRRQELLTWIMSDGWGMVTRLIPNATIDDARELVLTKHVVDKYRARYDRTVVKLWRDLEAAVRNAIGNRGQWFRVGRLSVGCGDKFLGIRLPSGRVMRYFDPRISGKDITYMGVEDGKYMRVKTYGGKLVENAVQAASADVMREALLRLDRAGYDLVLTVHDEAVAEAHSLDPGQDEFIRVMAGVPEWAAGLPVKVEGFESRRYRH